MFKLFYYLASIMWIGFVFAVIGTVLFILSFENFVIYSIIFLATLIEELYYMIDEKVIK